MKKKLLLHSCCGPCSTSVIERLKDDYELEVFFYNPNIMDPEEYEKRRQAQKQVVEFFGVPYIEGDKDTQVYLEKIKGLEEEAEGGSRCRKCFELRLQVTAKLAVEKGFDAFASTLSVSPHKSYKDIAEIGNSLAHELGLEFLNEDFKKKAGFQRSTQLAKEMELYRQRFCGCEFSR